MKFPTDDVLLLVTASRDWPAPIWLMNHLDHAFAAVLKADRNMVVMHGACPTGGDKFTDDWCEEVGCRVIRCPADWDAFGRSAGPMRNQQMVFRAKTEFRIAICVAFIYNRSPGTTGCARMAERAEIITHKVELNAGL